jgi:hypothetical protein
LGRRVGVTVRFTVAGETSLRRVFAISFKLAEISITQFFSALQELMAYAFEEYARLEKERRNQGWRRGTSDRPGILEEMQALLQHYRAELLAESGRLLQEGAT